MGAEYALKLKPLRRAPLFDPSESSDASLLADLAVFVPRPRPMQELLRGVVVHGRGCYVLSGRPGSGKTSLVNILHRALTESGEEPIRKALADGWLPKDLPWQWPQEPPLVVRVELPAEYSATDLLTRIVRETCRAAIDELTCTGQHSDRIECLKEARQLLDWTLALSRSATMEIETTAALSATAEVAFGILPALLTKAGVKVGLNAALEQARKESLSRSLSLTSKPDTVERLEVLFRRVVRLLQRETGAAKWHSSDETEEFLARRLPSIIAREEAKRRKGKQLPTNFLATIREKIAHAFKQAKSLQQPPLLEGAAVAFRRILVILDNVDRETHEDALRCLRALQGMVRIPGCCFIIVGSHQFYEDDLTFQPRQAAGLASDLFDSVVYLPPFSSREVSELLTRYRDLQATGLTSDELQSLANALTMITGSAPRDLVTMIDAMSDYRRI